MRRAEGTPLLAKLLPSSRTAPLDALLLYPQSIFCGLRGCPLHKLWVRAMTFLFFWGSRWNLPSIQPWVFVALIPPLLLPGASSRDCVGFGVQDSTAARLIHPVPECLSLYLTWAASWQLLQKLLPVKGREPCAHRSQMISEILRQKPMSRRNWKAGLWTLSL